MSSGFFDAFRTFFTTVVTPVAALGVIGWAGLKFSSGEGDMKVIMQTAIGVAILVGAVKLVSLF